MIFWGSAEVDFKALEAFVSVEHIVEPYLNKAFANSSLSELDAKIRYVPIVMHDDRKSSYPARSKLRKKQRIYDCAPQLDYDIYISGTQEEQLAEYLRGVAESAPHLAGLGATAEQVQEFERIVENAVKDILANT